MDEMNDSLEQQWNREIAAWLIAHGEQSRADGHALNSAAQYFDPVRGKTLARDGRVRIAKGNYYRTKAQFYLDGDDGLEER